jgi:hypothetical protein
VDADRKIRFLLSPILFLASLVWGAQFDPMKWLWLTHFLHHEEGARVVELVAGAGLLVFVVGYVIGTITLVLLRLPFALHRRDASGFWTSFFRQSHEANLTDETLHRVLSHLGAPNRAHFDAFYAAVAFDHGLLRSDQRTEGVHAWLVRRWSGFTIAATSAVGLVLALLFGKFVLGITASLPWLLTTLAFGALVILVAIWSWTDVMNMLDFMSRLPTSTVTKE